ncbi:hypothetical protein M9Y10_018620 [Tritrichomonas musculus]|uniref:Initiator binding domain-containing protein n=1 Tax=Tritrichomonas musculus TaxID=1915356 RepID=A0ABR2HN21_9EUKA
MDSVCSSWAYSRLKNKIDPNHEYHNFEKLNIEAPMYVLDIKPRISDVIKKYEDVLDPIFHFAPVVPIFDGDKYETLLPVDDITSYFLKINSHTHPVLLFRIDNIGKLIQGRYIKKGPKEEFQTTIAFAMMVYEKYEKFMKNLKGPMPVVLCGNRRKYIDLAMKMNCPAITKK